MALALPAFAQEEVPEQPKVPLRWAAGQRRKMIRTIRSYKIHPVTDRKVLEVMRRVPRHEFVPDAVMRLAYQDRPLPIGRGQTISQPYIVAIMTQYLELKKGDKVLEIGTGSGYQAAILAEMGARVYTIEIVKALARSAERTLDRLGYHDVHVKAGDGYKGWPRAAPFDAVIVTCSPNHVPEKLKEQLKVGGKLVIPVGTDQKLVVLIKTEAGFKRKEIMDVRFVPMTGMAQDRIIGGKGLSTNPGRATDLRK
ncbi:MAG: protein-L-isoaspartate O-methyltransferase [Elusimicrobia bacterium]|nr:MAG: protein-L-isoaspartate O-methyltransferase [Elusimicrobiota bacterium]